MDSRIRLLQLTPALQVGGAERMLVDLVRHLDRSRFEIGIVSMSAPHHTPIEKELVELGVPVHFLNKHLGPDVRMLRRIDRIVQEFRPHVVHTHRFVLRYVVPLILAHKMPRVLHTLHTLVEQETACRPRWMARLAFRRGVVPVAICEDVAAGVRRLHGEDCPIIPNGIPVDAFSNAAASRATTRRKLGLAEGALVVVSVGRLSPEKNHAMLLNAFSRVAGDVPTLDLLIVGEGPLEERLAALANRLGVAERVRFLGNRTDIPEILAASDIFVLASNWEGNPLTVMEAMSAGLPVICTAVGGVPELVTHGVTGCLVPSGDINALAGVMAELAGDPTRRVTLGAAAAREAPQRFNVSRMAAAYAALYEQLAVA